MSRRRDFALSLIPGLRNVLFCARLCHLFRCFDSKFKEDIHWHPTFIIRDINICRNSCSLSRPFKIHYSDH